MMSDIMYGATRANNSNLVRSAAVHRETAVAAAFVDEGGAGTPPARTPALALRHLLTRVGPCGSARPGGSAKPRLQRAAAGLSAEPIKLY